MGKLQGALQITRMARPSHLLDLLDLLVASTDHIVGRVRNLLDLHEADEGIHLGGQQQVQLVAVVAQRHADTGGDLADVNVLVNIYDVLSLGMDLHAGVSMGS